ncbi:unnamed protein product [Cylicocyclus nassatus]|uniref:Uncharacterized protein n=1 Tax=Cylicocyclus nassatus TaxID=53992 RepID=A0AA36DSP1_CYLNA|nr:unnamed protein product [Cylicocyclus nassatus]
MILHLSSKTGSIPASEEDLAINTIDTYNSLSSSHAQTLFDEPEESQQCSHSNAAYLNENEMLASNLSSEVQQEDVELTALQSFQTHADRRRQRLAADAKRAAFGRAKETEHERSLRLAALAKRARLTRTAESEEEKLVRLAKNAERERARRLAIKERSKVTKSDENKQKSSQESSVQHGHGEGLHHQFPSTSRAYGSKALDIQQSPPSHYCEAASAAALIEDQLMSDPHEQNGEKSSDEDPRTSVVLSSDVEEYHGESERLTTTELLCTTTQPAIRALNKLSIVEWMDWIVAYPTEMSTCLGFKKYPRYVASVHIFEVLCINALTKTKFAQYATG